MLSTTHGDSQSFAATPWRPCPTTVSSPPPPMPPRPCSTDCSFTKALKVRGGEPSSAHASPYGECTVSAFSPGGRSGTTACAINASPKRFVNKLPPIWSSDPCSPYPTTCNMSPPWPAVGPKLSITGVMFLEYVNFPIAASCPLNETLTSTTVVSVAARLVVLHTKLHWSPAQTGGPARAHGASPTLTASGETWVAFAIMLQGQRRAGAERLSTDPPHKLPAP